MEEMKSRIPALNMTYYVNMRTIESVHRALDIPLSHTITSKMNGMYGGGEEEEGEVVEEEVDHIYTGGEDV